MSPEARFLKSCKILPEEIPAPPRSSSPHIPDVDQRLEAARHDAAEWKRIAQRGAEMADHCRTESVRWKAAFWFLAVGVVVVSLVELFR